MASNPKGSNANIVHALQRLGSAMEAQRAEAQHLAWMAALLAFRDARRSGERIAVGSIASALSARFPGEIIITTKNFHEYTRQAEIALDRRARETNRLNRMLEAICNA